MVHVPAGLKYTENHEWVSKEHNKNIAIIGITNYAQEQLGELIAVNLPEVGLKVAAGDEVCTIESVKAATEVFSPISGTIVAINEELEDAPGLINSDPYQDGWLYKIEIQDMAEYEELLDNAGYEEYIAELEEDY